MAERQRVTGIGGVFFKSRDPEALSQWYARHLGVPYKAGEGAAFRWADDPQADAGMTVWSAFPAGTKYFDPSPAPFMIDFRVADLDEYLVLHPLLRGTNAKSYGFFASTNAFADVV